TASLLQFRVFRFGFVEEGEVGVGVFPVGEEVLIGDTGLGSVALLLKQPSQLQLSDGEQRVGAVLGLQVQDLLKILLRFGVASGLLVGHASDEKDTGVGASVEGSRIQEVNGLGGIGLGGTCRSQGGDRANHRDGYIDGDGIVRTGALDLIG